MTMLEENYMRSVISAMRTLHEINDSLKTIASDLFLRSRSERIENYKKEIKEVGKKISKTLRK